MKKRFSWKALFQESATEFSNDDAMSLGAALAFYTALSLSPLLLILLWLASYLGPATERELIGQIVNLIGKEAGQAIEVVVRNANARPSLANAAGVVSVITLLLSAAGVFGQLQVSMNRIWDVHTKANLGVKGWLMKRLLSIGMVLSFGFLMIVSLILSTALSIIVEAFQNAVPGSPLLWEAGHFAFALGLFTVMFGLLFRYLPDVHIAWKDVWPGAFITALLFGIGKTIIGIYLGTGSVGSAYGAAGSLIVFLVWVYYSSLILFMGAEITQVWASLHGREIQPNEYAERGVHKETPPLQGGREAATRDGGGSREPVPPAMEPSFPDALRALSVTFASIAIESARRAIARRQAGERAP